MPLSPPAARKELHLRRVEVCGYQRDDGLWDIEGRLVDTKTYGFDNFDRGRIEAGDPIHEMRLRLTLDGESLADAALFALAPVTEGSLWRQATDTVLLWFE